MNLNAARRLRRCVPGFSIAGWRTWRELNPHPLSRTRERDLAGHTSFDSFPDGLPAGESSQGRTGALC